MTMRSVAGVVCALALLAGCATSDMRFTPNMTIVFVNEAGDQVVVDYAKEERTTTLRAPDGSTMPFKSSYKVRATFPSGYRFIAYNVPSPRPELYRSDDGEWELLSRGFDCTITEFFKDGFEVVFSGIVAAQEGKGMSNGDRTKGQRVYSSSREHADDTNRPKRGKK